MLSRNKNVQVFFSKFSIKENGLVADRVLLAITSSRVSYFLFRFGLSAFVVLCVESWLFRCVLQTCVAVATIIDRT